MEGGLSELRGLDSLDWASPWYQPFGPPGRQAARFVLQGHGVAQALNAVAGARDEPAAPAGCGSARVRFVAQDALPAGQAYEQFIYEQRACPTRENLHDFFNGLVWLRLPRAKARLNALQAGQIAQRGVGAVRGPVRDAITVFDENGALLEAPQPLWDALLARQWQRLFVELRPLWPQARLVLFGHALLEKLVAPRKDMTAHVWRVPAPAGVLAAADSLDAADAWLASQLDEPTLAAKPFTPLPVLGVPGWWPANEVAAFYDDARVFRPARARD